jgi:hypothetical protein
MVTQNFLGDEKNFDIYSLRVRIEFETFLIKRMTVPNIPRHFNEIGDFDAVIYVTGGRYVKSGNVVHCGLIMK